MTATHQVVTYADHTVDQTALPGVDIRFGQSVKKICQNRIPLLNRISLFQRRRQIARRTPRRSRDAGGQRCIETRQIFRRTQKTHPRPDRIVIALFTIPIRISRQISAGFLR